MKNRMITMEEGYSVILGGKGTWTSFRDILRMMLLMDPRVQ